MTKVKPVVLTFSDFYLPGYKGGGCIRGVANLIEQLGDEFHFRVVTRDRDWGDTNSYPKVKVNSWQKLEKAEVLYLTPEKKSIDTFRKIICNTEHQVLYFNSFFSPTFTTQILLLRKFKLIPNVPIIVAPRGEFSLGAFASKKIKKEIYLLFSNSIDLYKNIIWQASSIYESEDIQRQLGKRLNIVVAPELPNSIKKISTELPKSNKEKGILKIVFLSRIVQKKNLYGALEMLKNVQGTVYLNIYGPIEDEIYWQKCQILRNLLPENIQVQYRGPIPQDEVRAAIQEHHLFFLPTLGENFGYVILEALQAGCPVLISDQTIWRGLEDKGVGWDFPLEQPKRFQAALQQCVEMDAQTYAIWSQQAQRYGLQYSENEQGLEQNRSLFWNAVKGKEN